MSEGCSVDNLQPQHQAWLRVQRIRHWSWEPQPNLLQEHDPPSAVHGWSRGIGSSSCTVSKGEPGRADKSRGRCPWRLCLRGTTPPLEIDIGGAWKPAWQGVSEWQPASLHDQAFDRRYVFCIRQLLHHDSVNIHADSSPQLLQVQQRHWGQLKLSGMGANGECDYSFFSN